MNRRPEIPASGDERRHEPDPAATHAAEIENGRADPVSGPARAVRPAAAERKRQSRARLAEGVRVLKIPADVEAVSRMLTQQRLLAPEDADDLRKVETALAKAIAALSDRFKL